VRYWIHHKNGEIMCREYTNAPSVIPGATRIEVSEDAYHFGTHKVIPDPEYVEVIVEKTAAERFEYHLPSEQELKVAILNELEQSDKTQVPDYPISDEERARWKAYRQALRRLSDHASPVAMVKHWPVHPKAKDPIPHLRARVDKSVLT
jgi:hypothetical protein